MKACTCKYDQCYIAGYADNMKHFLPLSVTVPIPHDALVWSGL